MKLFRFTQPFNLFSKKKFYQIVADDHSQPELPEFPQQVILSTFLTDHESKQQQENLTFTKWQKSDPKNTQLSYQQLLNSSPYGSIKNFEYKKHNLTFISTNYHRVQQKKLHKFLYVNKPNALVVQKRPDYYVRDFQILKMGADGIFSDRAYLEQLSIQPQGLDLEDTLQYKNNPLDKVLHTRKSELLEKYPTKQLLREEGFYVCQSYVRSYQDTQMYLGQIPMRSFKQWLANKNTLMELQQMFKNTCKRLPRYKNLSFTPYQLATLIYPDTFLKVNDLYMATIIQMIISLKKYNKIVGFFSIMQNQSVKHFLQSGKALQQPLIDLLIPPGPKGTIVRDIQPLQIIQKHILLDVFFYGDSILDIATKNLHVTNQIIQKYAKDQNTKIQRETLIKFRYEKTMQYIGLMSQKYKEGEQEIKKQFVRETLK